MNRGMDALLRGHMNAPRAEEIVLPDKWVV